VNIRLHHPVHPHMRYLPLLFLAGCVFDTDGNPGRSHPFPDADGSGAVEVLRDASDHDAEENPDDAAIADLDAEVPELDAAAEDAAEPTDGATDAAVDAATPPEDAAAPEDAEVPEPEPIELCEQCDSSLECVAGTSCRYSNALLLRLCLPNIPETGTCAELCPSLPLPENGVCHPMPSTTFTCSCE
jgi:hypothetical protein